MGPLGSNLRASISACTMNSRPPNALARIESPIDVLTEDSTWQRLWLNLESQSWRSLAVIPAGDSSSIEVVHALATVAWHQPGTAVIVADFRTIGLPALTAARQELRRRIDTGERVLIGMNSLEINPTAATIARDADKVLVCVTLGRTLRAQVRNAVREIGVQRCLGSILLREGP